MQRFWWLSLVRGTIALVISLLILAWPQSATSFFVNFLALYWLSSGAVGLRAGLSIQQQKGFWLAIDLLEIVVGVALLLRSLYQSALSPDLALKIFGWLALCVGLARFLGGYRIDKHFSSTLILSLFEVGLGVLLILSDTLGPLTRVLAEAWTLVGGISLILQAFQTRKLGAAHSS